MGYTGMSGSTVYGFCLAGSGTGSTNQCFCLEQVIHFAIPTLEHGRGYFFAARIALQMDVVAVPARVPLHVYPHAAYSHTVSDSKVNHISHFSV